ncbi:PAS domain S-box protein [Algoriphagus pacificus]|uniref:histidine kinase n=1 Tax=Algoriphagus pacificus TaxID=2811234 RepID=A0ABS3CJU7_9BACT|nr:PAS domain S-box protein [Algoriphagus pacificus]MBN7817371.1 PAS domain S-box protein [Algoriphagus pacificus]
MNIQDTDSAIPNKESIQIIQQSLSLFKTIAFFISAKSQTIYLNQKANDFLKTPNSEWNGSYVSMFPELDKNELEHFYNSNALDYFETVKFNHQTNQTLKHDFSRAENGFFVRVLPILSENPNKEFELKSIELLNSLDQGVIVISEELDKISFINKYFIELTGLDEITFLNKSKQEQLQMILPLSQDLVQQIESENPVQKETWILDKNGKNVCYLINPIQFDSNHGKKTFIYIQNTNQEGKTENQSNVGYNKFSSLFDKMPEGILIQNECGDIIYANPAAEKILDFDPEKIIGRPFNFRPNQVIQLDGSFLPLEKYPHIIALNTGNAVEKSILGFYNKKKDSYTWVQSNTTPEFRPGESKPYQIFNSFIDITSQIKAEKKVEQQKELLKLMVSTSTSYMNIPEEKLPLTIQKSLKKLGEYVEADRMYIFDYNWQEKTCTNTYEWCAEGIEPQIEHLQNIPLEGLEDWTGKHLTGEYLYVENVQDLNQEEILWQILEPQGIQSLMTMPIMDNQHCLGFIGLDSVKKIHKYSENEINLLNIFSGIIANVITRLNRERDLKERIKELNTIYKVSSFTNQGSLSEAEIFQKIVDIIPPGFLIPEETSARLIYKNQTFTSPNFQESNKSIEEPIKIKGEALGLLQVYIPDHKKFLIEEYSLIKTITNTLDQHLEANENLIQIKNNESRLRNLVNSQTSFVLRTDLKGIKKYWNQKYEDEFSWLIQKFPKEQPINVFDFICDYHHERAKEALANCLENPGKIFSVELDKPGKDGKTVTVLAEYSALVDEKGIPSEIQCMGVDISKRKESEIKLIESEKRLRSLIDSQTNYIIRTDLNGIHTFWNNKFERDFSHCFSNDLKDSNSLVSICEYHHERTREAVFKCLESPGSVVQVELDKPGKDGNILTTIWEFTCITDSYGIPFEMQCVGIDITDRKKTQQKLEESERRLIQVTDHSGSVVWETNKDGLFTYMSPACERIFGYHPDEIINKKYFFDLFPPSLREEFTSLGKNKIESALGILDIENPIQKKNGEIIWVATHGVAVRDEDGNTIKVLGVDNDITERKIQEKQIKDQNDRLQAIVEAIPDILYVMDEDGNYLEYYSSTIHNEIGDYSYLVGKNIREAFQEKEADLHLSKIQAALASGKVETYEYPGMIGHEKRFFESRIIAMSPKKVLRFVREITERKKSELEIKKLSQAVEQSPVAIVITDLEGEIEYLNSAYSSLIEEDTEKILGTPLSFISNIYSNRLKKEELWAHLNSGIPFTIECEYKKNSSSETLWKNVTITPIQNERNDIIKLMVIIQDVTEQKAFENQILELNLSLEKRIEARTEELKNSNLELKKAQLEAEFANQAKSEFLSRMSHELRTPMNSILGFAQLLEFTDLKANQKRNLDFILKSGDHLLNLINEILDISRIESGMVTVSLETLELNNLIEEVAESIMPAAISKSVSVHYPSSQTDFIYVKADLQRLKQIFINLINNAIKYNKENGTVTIDFEEVPENKIKVHIKDTGVGISEEDLPKLFKPFERAGNNNSNIEGTGLGLSVVEKLANLMQAKVGVTSEIGKGSDFWIELPIATESFETLEKEIESEPFKNGGSDMHHLLLIEDNNTNIELISELLHHVKPQCHVHPVMGKKEAISLAKEYHPSLILLDLNLPDIHGSEILDTLKSDQDLKDIPVVIVSADATAKQIEAMIKKGAEHYVTKPINVNNMVKIFEDYLS